MNGIGIAVSIANVAVVYDEFEAEARQRYPALIFKRTETTKYRDMEADMLTSDRRLRRCALMSAGYIYMPPVDEEDMVCEIYVDLAEPDHYTICMYRCRHNNTYLDDVIMSWRLTPKLCRHRDQSAGEPTTS